MLIILVGAVPSLWAPFDPVDIVGPRLAGPSSDHYFGTDQLGRDILSRVIHGAQIALLVGLVAMAISTFGGTMIGVASGYIGGRFDIIVQRVMDGLIAIPGLILAMTIVMVLGPSTFNAILAISVGIIPGQNRVIRGVVLSLSKNDYVLAAQAIGASRLHIMVRHIFPNVVPIMLILATGLLGGAILIEASLSFLGLGTQPPNPSWGNMLSREARAYLEIDPWLAVFPGVALTLTVLAFNLAGDAIRDLVDPRLKGTS